MTLYPSVLVQTRPATSEPKPRTHFVASVSSLSLSLSDTHSLCLSLTVLPYFLATTPSLNTHYHSTKRVFLFCPSFAPFFHCNGQVSLHEQIAMKVSQFSLQVCNSGCFLRTPFFVFSSSCEFKLKTVLKTANKQSCHENPIFLFWVVLFCKLVSQEECSLCCLFW